jgi:thioredoxin reductase (NADPH)
MDDFFNYDNLLEEYDLVIIGAGPAGLTAGIYAGRDNLKTLIIEKNFPGGQTAITDFIENYPGFPDGIKGGELAERMHKQALKFNVQIKSGICNKIEIKDNYKYIHLENNIVIKSKTLIIASGARAKHLNVPGEETFIGRGVSFCATCDGAFYKNKVVAVVGGGDSALQEGVYLTRFANKVFIIHRRDTLRASKGIQEKALNNPKIEFLWNSEVIRINGSNKIESITILDKTSKTEHNLGVDGVFIYIGWIAETEAYKDLLKLDEFGFIKADESTKTNCEGIYAAGDIRSKEFKQIVTALADGAVAAKMAEHYIDDLTLKEVVK